MRAGVVPTKIRMRRKSQLTLPEQTLRKLDLKPGDELIVRVDEDQPELIQPEPQTNNERLTAGRRCIEYTRVSQALVIPAERLLLSVTAG